MTGSSLPFNLPSRKGRLWFIGVFLGGLTACAIVAYQLGSVPSVATLPPAAYELATPWLSSSTEQPVPGPWRDIKQRQDDQFGIRFFKKSVGYGGTNTRLRRVIRKLIRQEPVKIGVLGGSITAGANMPRGANTEDHRWFGHFHRLLKDAFPMTDIQYKAIGLGGLGSDYFAWCASEYLWEENDLVVVEHAVNDHATWEAQDTFEDEIRSLLQRPERPAVVAIEFNDLDPPSGRLENGGSRQINVARFYDVPFLSLRNPLLPEIIAHPDRIPTFYGRDHVFGRKDQPDITKVNLRHPASHGHFAMGNVVLHHLLVELEVMIRENAIEADPEEINPPENDNVVVSNSSILERTEEQFTFWTANDQTSYLNDTQWGSELYTQDVPRIGLSHRFNFTKTEVTLAGRCDALSGTQRKLQFETVDPGRKVGENLKVLPEAGEGWVEWSSPQSFLNKPYVRTTDHLAIVKFNLDITGRGDVAIMYLRSKAFGLGNAACWVDDNKDKAVTFHGQWEVTANIGVHGLVATGLSPGPHALFCQTNHGNDFRIIAVQTL